MPFIFMWAAILLFGLLFGIEMDTGKVMKTRTVMQGGADAATLAGAMQNHQVVTKTDGSGAPVEFDFVLNTNSSPEDAAIQTWEKNKANWTSNVGQGTTPYLGRTSDQKGVTLQVLQTVDNTITQNVTNTLFKKPIQSEINVPVRSVSKIP